jgi:FMN-dependent NADH-azoreductase
MQLLHIDSSVLGPHSASRALSAEIVARQVALRPGITVVHRDLSYLMGVLSFIGLTDVTVVRAEGLAFGAEAKEAAMLQARANIAAMAA